MPVIAPAKREQLIRDGFCVFEQVLDPETVARLNAMSEWTIALVVGDARLLHSAHGNRSDRRRTVLTIWYWPAYDELPAEIQALVARHLTDSPEWRDWVTQTQSITRPLIPVYAGAAEPPAWCPAPGAALR